MPILYEKIRSLATEGEVVENIDKISVKWGGQHNPYYALAWFLPNLIALSSFRSEVESVYPVLMGEGGGWMQWGPDVVDSQQGYDGAWSYIHKAWEAAPPAPPTPPPAAPKGSIALEVSLYALPFLGALIVGADELRKSKRPSAQIKRPPNRC